MGYPQQQMYSNNISPQSPQHPNAPFLSQRNLGNVSYQSSVDNENKNEKKMDIVDIVQQADPPQIDVYDNEDAMEVISSQISTQDTEDLLYDTSHRRMTNQGNGKNEEGMDEGDNDMIIQSDTSMLDAKNSQNGNEMNAAAPNLQMHASDHEVLNDDYLAEVEP